MSSVITQPPLITNQSIKEKIPVEQDFENEEDFDNEESVFALRDLQNEIFLLKKDIKKMNNQCEFLKGQLERRTKIMRVQRSEYYKQLMALKEMLYQRMRLGEDYQPDLLPSFGKDLNFENANQGEEFKKKVSKLVKEQTRKLQERHKQKVKMVEEKMRQQDEENKKEIEKLTKEHENAAGAKKELELELKRALDEYEADVSSITEKYEGQITELQESRDKEVLQLTKDLARLEDDYEESTTQIAKLSKLNDDLDLEVDFVKKELETKTSEVQEQREAIERLKNSSQNSTEKIDGLTKELDFVKSDYDTYRDTTQETIKSLEFDRDSLMKRVDAKRQECEKLMIELDHVKSEGDSRMREVQDQYERAMREKEQQGQDTELKINRLERDLSAAEEELIKLRAHIRDLESQLEDATENGAAAQQALEDELRQLKEEETERLKEIAALKEELLQATQSVHETKELARQASQRDMEQESTIISLSQQIADLEESISSSDADFQVLKGENARLLDLVERIKAERDEAIEQAKAKTNMEYVAEPLDLDNIETHDMMTSMTPRDMDETGTIMSSRSSSKLTQSMSSFPQITPSSDQFIRHEHEPAEVFMDGATTNRSESQMSTHSFGMDTTDIFGRFSRPGSKGSRPGSSRPKSSASRPGSSSGRPVSREGRPISRESRPGSSGRTSSRQHRPTGVNVYTEITDADLEYLRSAAVPAFTDPDSAFAKKHQEVKRRLDDVESLSTMVQQATNLERQVIKAEYQLLREEERSRQLDVERRALEATIRSTQTHEDIQKLSIFDRLAARGDEMRRRINDRKSQLERERQRNLELVLAAVNLLVKPVIPAVDPNDTFVADSALYGTSMGAMDSTFKANDKQYTKKAISLLETDPTRPPSRGPSAALLSEEVPRAIKPPSSPRVAKTPTKSRPLSRSSPSSKRRDRFDPRRTQVKSASKLNRSDFARLSSPSRQERRSALMRILSQGANEGQSQKNTH
ncbi:hypothetical protein PCE1_002589 [Barthelona sp. PCE]